MGRTISKLKPFIGKRIADKNFPNLYQKEGYICLRKPRYKSKGFNEKDENIFKDWEKENGRPYRGYVTCKDVLVMAIKRSNYYKIISYENKVLKFYEVTPKIVRKKKEKKSVAFSMSPSSSSGYETECYLSPVATTAKLEPLSQQQWNALIMDLQEGGIDKNDCFPFVSGCSVDDIDDIDSTDLFDNPPPSEDDALDTPPVVYQQPGSVISDGTALNNAEEYPNLTVLTFWIQDGLPDGPRILYRSEPRHRIKEPSHQFLLSSWNSGSK